MKPIDKIPVRIIREEIHAESGDIWSVYHYLVDDKSSINMDADLAILIDQTLELYDHAQDILRKLAGD